MFRRRYYRRSSISTINPKEMEIIEFKIYKHKQDCENEFISVELIPPKGKGERKILAFVGRIDLRGSVGKVKLMDYDYITQTLRIRFTQSIRVTIYKSKSLHWEIVMPNV